MQNAKLKEYLNKLELKMVTNNDFTQIITNKDNYVKIKYNQAFIKQNSTEKIIESISFLLHQCFHHVHLT